MDWKQSKNVEKKVLKHLKGSTEESNHLSSLTSRKDQEGWAIMDFQGRFEGALQSSAASLEFEDNPAASVSKQLSNLGAPSYPSLFISQ